MQRDLNVEVNHEEVREDMTNKVNAYFGHMEDAIESYSNEILGK